MATFGWITSGRPITLDPNASPLLVGDLNTSIALDPAPPCNCGNDTSSILRNNLSLSYNSDTVDVRPIIQTTFQTDPNAPLPTQIQVTLTWNGVAQPPVTFQTTGHSPGDSYLLSVQAAAAATATGSIPYSVLVQATLPGGTIVQGTTSGMAFVVVNGPSDPIGQGWSLGGSAKLFPDGQGGLLLGLRRRRRPRLPGRQRHDVRQPAQRLRHAGQERQRDVHLHRPAADHSTTSTARAS